MLLYSCSCQRSDLRASSWSLSSNSPSFFFTRWRRFVPWNPLPRPSRLMTMVLKELTSTVVQSTWNCSVTIWPPGVPSLSQLINRFSICQPNSTYDLINASKQYHHTFTAVSILCVFLKLAGWMLWRIIRVTFDPKTKKKDDMKFSWYSSPVH